MPSLSLAWARMRMSCNKPSFLAFLGLFLSGLFFLSASVFAAAPVKVLAISNDFASIAKAVGGDAVDVDVLVKGSRDMHHISPKPSMVIKMRDADLLIRMGMGIDSWIDGLITVARNRSVFKGASGYLDASVGIRKLDVPTGNVDWRHGDVHVEGNPHYYLDPRNGVVIAASIRDKLIALDPENELVYRSGYQQFSEAVKSRFSEWQTVFSSLKPVQLFTYHSTFSYFFDAFSLQSQGTLEVVPGIAPTARHLLALSQTVSQSEASLWVLMADIYPQSKGRHFVERHNGRLLVVPINAASADATAYIALFDTIAKQVRQ